MTHPTRDHHIAHTLDPDTPDAHTQRAINAVRDSSPEHLLAILEEEDLFDVMLDRMKPRFNGRPLHTITTPELTHIARDAIDETLGLRTPTPPPAPHAHQEPPENPPEPHPAERTMTQLARIVNTYTTGGTSATQALAAVHQTLRSDTRNTLDQ